VILAVVGSFYVMGAAPGITWLDAGELAAASHELGIAHPPGLPVFSLINKFVCLIFPFGDVAFRSNISSGLLAALALIIAVRCFGFRDILVSLPAAALAMTAPILVLHSTTVEVYAGAALLAMVSLWTMIRAHQEDDQRWLICTALVLGVALGGHHAELRLIALFLFLPCLLISRSIRQVIASLIAGTTGALVILYLPIRSARPVWRDWGDPSSLTGTWDHFWGARIRAAYGQEMGSLELSVLEQLWEQLALGAPALIILGGIGCVLALRRRGGWLLGALLLLDLAYSVFINPMGVRDMQNGVISIATLGAGSVVALQALYARWPSQAVRVGIFASGLTASLLAFQGFSNAQDRGLRMLTEQIADVAPVESLVLVASDNFAAGLAYDQVVEGSRPDLAVIVRQHVRYPSSMEPTQRRLPHALKGWRPGHGLTDIEALNTDWPVLWEWSGNADMTSRPDSMTPTYPVFSPSLRPQLDFEAQLKTWIETNSIQIERDEQARRTAANLSTDIAQFRLSQGQTKRAVTSLERALQLRPHQSNSWTNLGAGLAADGQAARAVLTTERALEIDPQNHVASLNLGRFLILTKNWPRAASVLKALIDVEPSADAYGLLGVALGNAGELLQARGMFKQALRLDPNQPEAKSGLSRLAP
jgi:tetratricopeptide (TPR) repeat protein